MLCHNGQRYEGYVEGLGYVYWHPIYINLPVSGLPSQTQYNTPRGAMFTATFYEMVVIGVPQEIAQEMLYEEQEKMAEVLNLGAAGVTVASIGKTIEAMSNTPMIVGPEYNVSSKGQFTRNFNREYTNRGKLASKFGEKLFYAGLVIDWSLVATGKKEWKDATVNSTINFIIFRLGSKHPIVGVILGIIWSISGSSGVSGSLSSKRYIDNMRNNCVQRDNTNVVIPDINIQMYINSHKNIFETQQYSFTK
jgi:hypothetical protein